MPKISITSKLDGIRSWSLQAIDTCPASWDSEGQLVPACSGCYATTGNYRFPNVKAPREFNRLDWQKLEWVDDMVKELEKDRFFRWLDSGDLYSLALAQKVYEVMKRTPWCKHWLPTRIHKFPKFQHVFNDMKKLKNVSVRFSSDYIDGTHIKGLHGSVIIPSAEHVQKNMFLCKAYENNGTCSGCRACFDQKIKLIAYPAHGKKLMKIINLKKVA